MEDKKDLGSYDPEGTADAVSVPSTGWQPIETAPDMERVRVCGYQNRSGGCAGYWWHHEDVIVDGKPFDHPNALLWQSLPPVPDFIPEGAKP